MTAPLAGLTLVVARPQRQAGPFIAQATSAGAHCIALPAIEIETLKLRATDRERLAPDEHDWVIYTSANAVEASLAQLPPPGRCRVAAVGRATARALEAHGVVVHALPEGRSDTEGLLALPVFASVRGRRILIVRGVGGRQLLREQLQARGAVVNVAEVYRRGAARADPAALAALTSALAAATSRVVVVVTSVEVLDGLLGLLPPDLAQQVRDCTLLLPGTRVAYAAGERQWRGRVLTSPSAEDATMLATLSAHATGGGAASPA
ncbi:MAG TPA: uroporphyrinogen-III synthase [Steroidobacteraceae bacterium]